jgi:hypothetical protein
MGETRRADGRLAHDRRRPSKVQHSHSFISIVIELISTLDQAGPHFAFVRFCRLVQCDATSR